jgi:hypothetical protein
MMLLAAATLAIGFAPSIQAQSKPIAKEAVLSALTSKVDTKKAKVGDTVTAKTLNSLTLLDGTVLPAGTKIVGKVTQVQPKSGGTAMLAIDFSEIDKKGAAPMAVHGVLQAVAPQPSMSDAGASTNDLPMGSGGNKGQTAGLTGTGIGGSGSSAATAIQPGSSIKGVVLNPTGGPDGASDLQSTDKDIKLDSGTRIEIGFMSAP